MGTCPAGTAAPRASAPGRASVFGDAVAVAGFALDPAATPTQGQVGALPTFFGEAVSTRVQFPVAEGDEQVAVPNGFPGVVEDIPGGNVVGLAGQDIAVGFDAHGVFPGVAAFRPNFEFDGGHTAVFGGGVPEEAHPQLFGGVADADEQGRHFVFGDGHRVGKAAAGVDHAIHRKGAYAEVVEEVDDVFGVAHVGAHERGVGDDVNGVVPNSAVEGVADTAHSLVEGFCAHHRIVNPRVAGAEGDLDVVEARVREGLHVRSVGDLAAIRVEADDMAEGIGVMDDVRKLRVKGGLAAGEYQMGDAHLVKLVNDFEPVFLGHGGEVVAVGFVVAVGTFVVAPVGEGEVYFVGGVDADAK